MVEVQGQVAVLTVPAEHSTNLGLQVLEANIEHEGGNFTIGFAGVIISSLREDFASWGLTWTGSGSRKITATSFALDAEVPEAATDSMATAVSRREPMFVPAPPPTAVPRVRPGSLAVTASAAATQGG